jgi:predicted nucleic-acid-binding Zn-ribbon protein
MAAAAVRCSNCRCCLLFGEGMAVNGGGFSTVVVVVEVRFIAVFGTSPSMRAGAVM